MWRDLSWEQGNSHSPSIYNAALHNKSGWSTAARAVIKYQLPQLPEFSTSDGVEEHVQIVYRFCIELLRWMKKFARASVEYWGAEEYERERAKCALRSWVLEQDE